MSQAQVLLIEDNAITRKLVRHALESNGIGVAEAVDGRTALRMFANQSADLILQELVLPDIDGCELVAQLRALPGGTEMPILAVSGFLSKPDEARMSAVGFNDVITKPVEPARLLQVVRAHLPPDELSDGPFGAGRRLVVVDDDPVQRKLLCFRLQRLGFTTTPAADGVEALDLARQSRPDGIISDVMMPGLDGFGLCVAVREDPKLQGTPLVLITNSYIEDGDRDLARRAGANEFVVRTPGMREVAEALRGSLSTGRAKTSNGPKRARDLGTKWSRRVMSQLEKQVSLNAGIAQRCATLSAELSILSGISEALTDEGHIDDVLVDVLSACFDAGGISLGALYLRSEAGLKLHKVGAWGTLADADITTFFGRPELLAEIVAAGRTVRIPSDPRTVSTGAALRGAGIASALLVPVRRRNEAVGALLMGSKTDNLEQDDRILFMEGVATQIGQALTLSQSFADKDASEKKSRAQATVLRSILESIAEGVVVTDEAGRVVMCNPAAETILEQRPFEVPPDQWAEHHGLAFPDTLSPVPPEESPFLRAIRGESIGRMEVLLKPAGAGAAKCISVSATPLRDDAEKIGGAVAVFRDVTAEKATQAQLMVADRLASVGMLAAGVAHEINNPLASVLGNLDFVLEKLDEAEALEDDNMETQEIGDALREARAGAVRIRQIVRDLRVFSRTEKEKLGAVDVHNVLDLALRMASTEVRHRARVVRRYGDVPLVEGNESRLGQVFLNLIVNAAQAIPDGRADENEIRVSTRTEGSGRVVVDIADTGAGMRPETMKHLFTPFFTTKPIGVGTGLGLSICHRLVAAAGGEISVESRFGEGTVFHVALLSAEPRRLSTAPPIAFRAVAARRGRILVVDDEMSILDVVNRVLGKDHDCVCVSSAKEALGRVLEEHFDLVLCDLMMPVMTGMDLYEELSAKAPEEARKVVFLTGGAFTPRARSFLADVPNEHIEKPFDSGALKEFVNGRLL